MARVSEDEVLMLWRAVTAFRSGRSPRCKPAGRPAVSRCPLFDSCDRWSGPDDWKLALSEDIETTESRRASWPCSRLLVLLGPETTDIGGR